MKVDKLIKQAIPVKPNTNRISDAEGLSKAYNASNSI
jgi:hypothetical protein